MKKISSAFDEFNYLIIIVIFRYKLDGQIAFKAVLRARVPDFLKDFGTPYGVIVLNQVKLDGHLSFLVKTAPNSSDAFFILSY